MIHPIRGMYWVVELWLLSADVPVPTTYFLRACVDSQLWWHLNGNWYTNNSNLHPICLLHSICSVRMELLFCLHLWNWLGRFFQFLICQVRLKTNNNLLFCFFVYWFPFFFLFVLNESSLINCKLNLFQSKGSTQMQLSCCYGNCCGIGPSEGKRIHAAWR